MNSRPQLATEEKALPKHKGTVSWVVLCITLLGLAATLGLGTWQLRRAAYKVALASQIESKNQLAAIENIAQTIGPIDQTKPQSDNPWINRRVDVKGTWLAEHTVFLDNRFMTNRAGFYVVTPLQQEGSNSVVWVQRGWVPRNVQDRTRLPDVPTPAGTVQVQGRVAAAVSRAYELGEAQNQPVGALRNASQAAPSVGSSAPASARASRIWQNLPTVNFGSQIQLMPVAVLQTATPNASQDGLLRDWPQAEVGVAKHYGYAFQWFALCGLIIALYVWFQILAPAANPHDASRMADTPLTMTVHDLPTPGAPGVRRQVSGRWKMMAVLLVCAAPIIASYVTFYVVRPGAQRNYGTLIPLATPAPELSASAKINDLPDIKAVALDGMVTNLRAFRGQWLLVSVAGGACDAACQQRIYLQRQMRESLGRDKDRLDRVWLIIDDQPVASTLVSQVQAANVDAYALRVPQAALAQWLKPDAGQQLSDHLYLVDPIGRWMMRFPADIDPTKAKRDLERLLRASGSWDRAGREKEGQT